MLVSLAYNATDVPSPLSDVIVVVNSPPALEFSSELILELLLDKEDVNELISVSIVITLWFSEPMFEECILIAVALNPKP